MVCGARAEGSLVMLRFARSLHEVLDLALGQVFPGPCATRTNTALVRARWGSSTLGAAFEEEGIERINSS